MTPYGPDERLSREYAPPRQAPRMPRNIMRRPIKVPGDGLPMEPVKDNGNGIEIGFAPSVEPAPDSGMQRLLDRLRQGDLSRVDQGVDVDAAPFCMACGLDAKYGVEVCPECGGDVYDPTAP